MQLTRTAAYALQRALRLARQDDGHIGGVTAIAETQNPERNSNSDPWPVR